MDAGGAGAGGVGAGRVGAVTPRPLLLAAHGSPDADGAPAVTALRDRVAARRPLVEVQVGFLSISSPSVRTVLASLAGQRPVVVPLLLTAASHSKTDLPALVQESRAGGADLAYGRPLGPHPLLLAAVTRLLGEAGTTSSAAVVLAAAGAADPAANAEVAALARLLSEERGHAPVEIAFAAATRPTVSEALRRLQLLGVPTAEIAVVPYLLFPGHFARLIATAAAAAGVARITGVLAGEGPEIPQLVWQRYDEALTGDLRMNCDLCVYRSPVAGVNQLVGAPQRRHPHPDDPPLPPAPE